MRNEAILHELKEQSTWRLVILTILTIGVYTAFYARRQTRRLNPHLTKETAMSEGFLLILVVSALLVIAPVFVSGPPLLYFLVIDQPEPAALTSFAEWFSKLSDESFKLYRILLIVWGFKMRNRLNTLCDLGQDHRFFWLPILFLPSFYFNWKINALNNEVDLIAHAEQKSDTVP